jgi:hypothetical protein
MVCCVAVTSPEQMASVARLSPTARVQHMHFKTLIVGLETELNRLKDQITTARSMSSDASAVWLQSAAKMKYGAKALRLAQEVDVAVSEVK